MSGTIKLKRSSVSAKIPATTDFTVGEVAANTNDGKMFLRGNNGSDFVVQIGGRVQRGLSWDGVSGLTPIQSNEFDATVYLFAQGSSQSVVALVHIPSSYVSGNQIKMRLGHYSSGVSNNFKLNTVTTLIRKNTDAINSTTNQYTSTNTDQAISATQYQYLEVIYDLTDATGKINSVAVNPSDLIKITLTRVATTGSDDSNDVRMIPTTTEIIFL